MLSELPVDVEDMDTKEHVAVGVRIRPLLPREVTAGANNAWSVVENTITHITTDKYSSVPSFTFDKVFDPESDNVQVYTETARPLILSALEGFNVTVFVYGQTASGKTYTMQGSREAPGIIPLTVRDLFSYTSNVTDDHKWIIKLNYVEIYNEEIRDLLNPNSGNLKIKEKFDKQIYIADVTEVNVSNEKDVFLQLKLGEKSRSFGETCMNDNSSRSHALLTFTLECYKSDQAQDGRSVAPIKSARINLIDLAGTERVSHSGAEGLRLKEGGKINQSLLTLSNVIQKLASRQSMREHIPYRDSKLTRILEPSLGGNSRTLIICTITPSSSFVEESLSTLKFANRAKNIKNEPRVNETFDISVQHLEEMIISLKTKLFQARENPPILARYQKLIECIFKMSSKKRKMDDALARIQNKKPKWDDDSFEWAIQEVESLAKEKEVAELKLLTLKSEKEELNAEKTACFLDLEGHKSTLKSLQEEVAKYLSELESRSSALSNLTQRLQEEKENKKQLFEEHASIKSQYTSLEEAFSQAVQSHSSMVLDHQAQIHNFTEELNKRQKSEDHAYSMFLASETQLRKVTIGLLSELKSVERKWEQVSIEKKALEAELDDAMKHPKKDVESLKTISQLQIHVEELTLSLETIQKEKENLLKELLERKSQLENAVQNVNKLQTELLLLQETHAELKREHEDLVAHQASLDSSIQSKENDHAELKKNYQESQVKQTQLQSLLEEQKQISLQAAAEKIQITEEIDNIRELQRKTNIQLDETQLRVKLLESANSQLQSVLKNVKEGHSDILEQKNALEEKLSALMIESKENEEKIKQLQTQLREMENLSNETQEHYAALLKEKKELEKKIEELQNELQLQLEKLYLSQKNESDVLKEKCELEMTLKNHQERFDQLNSKLENVQTELLKRENQMEQNQTEIQNLNQCIEDYRISQIQFTAQNVNIQSEITIAKTKLQLEEEKLFALEASESTLKGRLEESCDHVQKLQDEVLQYQMKLAQQEQVLQQLREGNQNLLSELEEVGSTLQEKVNELDEFHSKMVEKEKTMKALEQKIEALEYLKERHLLQLKQQEIQLAQYEESKDFNPLTREEMEEKCKQQEATIGELTNKLEETQALYQSKSQEWSFALKKLESLQRQQSTDYEAKIQSLLSELDYSKGMMQQLRQELDNEQSEKKALQEANAREVDSLAQAHELIQELKEKNEIMNAKESEEALKLQKIIEDQTHEIAEKTCSLKIIQIDLNSRLTDLEILHKENAQLTQKLEETEAALKEHTNVHNGELVQLRNAQQANLEAISGLEKHLILKKEEYSKLASSLDSLKREKEELYTELLRRDESLLQTEAHLKEKNSQIFKMENEHEKMTKELQQKYDSLQSDFQDQTMQLQLQKEKYEESEKQCEHLKTELSMQSEKVKAKEQLMKVLADQIEVTQTNLQTKTHTESLVRDLNLMLDATKKDLQEQKLIYSELRDEHLLLQIEVDRLKSLERDHNSLNQKYSHLEIDHKGLSHAYHQLETKCVELNALHSKMGAKFEAQSKEVEALKAYQHELKKRLKAYESHSKHAKENAPPLSSHAISSPLHSQSTHAISEKNIMEDKNKTVPSVKKDTKLPRRYPHPLKITEPKPSPQCPQQ